MNSGSEQNYLILKYDSISNHCFGVCIHFIALNSFKKIIKVNLADMLKKRILIKYGGNAIQSPDLMEGIAKQIKKFIANEFEVIVVHGGGPFINKALEEANIKSEFIAGQRYTSKEALVHIEKTLLCEVNAKLVSVFNKEGISALGLSGKDAGTVIAKRRNYTDEKGDLIDLGEVGDVQQISTRLLEVLLPNDFVPVVACIAASKSFDSYNVNADMMAGHLAAALKVDSYIVLTDVDGLFRDFPDPNSIINSISLDEVAPLYNKIIKGGMIPKLESCEIALRAGAESAVILNGTKPEQIFEYFFENNQLGTTITKNQT